MGYSTPMPEGKVARAFGNEMRTSWKNAINIARAIRGMPVRKAESYLEDVIALKRPVKFVKRNRKVAAKRGIGRGRFPQKSAENVLYVLRNAINNAEYAGYDPDEMVIVHCSAYKGRTIQGYMPRAHGRATDKNEDTTNVEIVIQEQEAGAEDVKKETSKAPGKKATPKSTTKEPGAEPKAQAKAENKAEVKAETPAKTESKAEPRPEPAPKPEASSGSKKEAPQPEPKKEAKQ